MELKVNEINTIQEADSAMFKLQRLIGETMMSMKTAKPADYDDLTEKHLELVKQRKALSDRIKELSHVTAPQNVPEAQ